MNEPGEPGEEQRIPLWTHGQAGAPVAPENWNDPAYVPPPGWDAYQAYTHPFYRDTRSRIGPGPARPYRGSVKVTAAVTAGALLFGLNLFMHGYLKPPAYPVASASASASASAPAPVPAKAPPTSDSGDDGPLIYKTGPHPADSPAPDDINGSVPLIASPTPGHEEARAQLGRPAPVAATSSAYAFTNKDKSGQPVTYDPCRPIHYVVRTANEPADGPELIEQAIAAVSQATGLVFLHDGATSEAPSAQREAYQPDRYGDRWAPVLIAWETTAEEPRFTAARDPHTVLGLGGSEAVRNGTTGFTYVSGQLRLNAPGLQAMIQQEGLAQARGTIEHELGHLVGLAHVQDPTQLMYPSATLGVTTYQAGDLNGLFLLGMGECRPGV
ncbi:peptidase M10A and M12B matrixin and adamalysin [Arthrobacter sp. YAF34]|uniref:peptidase M10A and M12B matrixin and adamalysin n=1 Tax=Arthrobacter sp. YAF34 TaxID=3233083 RepID=UPI003F9030F9